MQHLPYYTRAGAAKALGVSREAIRLAVLRGELRPILLEDDTPIFDIPSLADYEKAMRHRRRGGKFLPDGKERTRGKKVTLLDPGQEPVDAR